MDYTSFAAIDKEGCDTCGSVYGKTKNAGLATAYIPMQELDQVFPVQEALVKGTAFPELYDPKR